MKNGVNLQCKVCHKRRNTTAQWIYPQQRPELIREIFPKIGSLRSQLCKKRGGGKVEDNV